MSEYTPERDKQGEKEASDPTIDGVVATEARWDDKYYAVFHDEDSGDVILEGFTVEVEL